VSLTQPQLIFFVVAGGGGFGFGHEIIYLGAVPRRRALFVAVKGRAGAGHRDGAVGLDAVAAILDGGFHPGMARVIAGPVVRRDAAAKGDFREARGEERVGEEQRTWFCRSPSLRARVTLGRCQPRWRT